MVKRWTEGEEVQWWKCKDETPHCNGIGWWHNCCWCGYGRDARNEGRCRMWESRTESDEGDEEEGKIEKILENMFKQSETVCFSFM